MSHAAPGPSPGLTVFYDGSCPLCRSEMGLYRARDASNVLDLIDVSEPTARLPDGLDRETAMARFHLITADGEIRSGAAAFVEIWRRVPGWRWAARVASLPGALPVLEGAYRGFLLGRPALVRLFVAVRQLKKTR